MNSSTPVGTPVKGGGTVPGAPVDVDALEREANAIREGVCHRRLCKSVAWSRLMKDAITALRQQQEALEEKEACREKEDERRLKYGREIARLRAVIEDAGKKLYDKHSATRHGRTTPGYVLDAIRILRKALENSHD